MKRAVILIPGIMGSVLLDGGQVIWPGAPLEVLLPYKHMEALLKVDLIASDVIRKVSISTEYDDLINSLADCGFREGPGGNLKVFPYDWRKDNLLAAAALADCIDNLNAELGPDFAITLLAHSMGGLIGRCYLESGCYTQRAGFSNVRTLITMGTPHRGAPMALAAALGLEKRLFLSADQVKTLANDSNFPSLYQLLPPKSEPFAWDRTMEACFMPEDIYDPDIAKQLGLSAENLSSAVQFHASLDIGSRPSYVRYFFFAGTRQTTTHAIHVSKENNKRTIKKVDRDDAGDGTVPFWSASQSGIQTEPVGGEHGGIYKNSGLKAVLGSLLGKPGYMAANGNVAEIAVLEKVVNPESPIHLTIDFPILTLKVNGQLRLRRLVDANGLEVVAPTWAVSIPITYSGPDIDHLVVIASAPMFGGIYQVALFIDERIDPEATADFFVQELVS